MSHAAQLQPKEMAHPVLDMETAGITHVAAEQGIAFMALRAVSDGPRAPLPFDLESMSDEDFNLDIGKIIMTVLRHPHIILQSHRIVRNVEKAAENAAIALVAALGQLLPVLSPCNSLGWVKRNRTHQQGECNIPLCENPPMAHVALSHVALDISRLKIIIIKNNIVLLLKTDACIGFDL